MFHKNIINNDTNHKNYDTTINIHQSFSTYFNSIGKKIHTLPSCGLVTIQIARHILCSIRFWCGFVCQSVFFLTSTVLQSCRFYTGFIVSKLQVTISELQLQFQSFLQIPIASSLYYTTGVIRRPEIWGSNFCSPFCQYRQCFHENIINNHTNHKNYDATMHHDQSFSTYFNSIGKKKHTLPRCCLLYTSDAADE